MKSIISAFLTGLIIKAIRGAVKEIIAEEKKDVPIKRSKRK